MRESKYIESYLDYTAKRPITPGTYLAYMLRGTAKDYSSRYLRALERALERRKEAGTVVTVRSVGGRIAYIRRTDMRREANLCPTAD